MKSLVETVRKMSVKARKQGKNIDFLDHSLNQPLCQNIIKQMNSVKIKELGIQGTTSADDNYHFNSSLNKVTISGNDDYRLSLFFIKKGTVMPLHDHPNMSVYFKLMFGQLAYTSYDKLDSKFQYNQFSNNEYEELLETKQVIRAKKNKTKILNQNNLLLVRPSCGNMHSYVAEEDSCFFDICLPNYNDDIFRRCTYFNDISEHLECDLNGQNGHNCSKSILQYDTSPSVYPRNMDLTEIDYVGDFKDRQTVHQI